MYYWTEIRDYINKKYEIDMDDYKGKFKKGRRKDPEYCNFWHWLLSIDDGIHNGTSTIIPFDRLDPEVEQVGEPTPEWVLEILTLIRKEFAPKAEELEVWVEW